MDVSMAMPILPKSTHETYFVQALQQFKCQFTDRAQCNARKMNAREIMREHGESWFCERDIYIDVGILYMKSMWSKYWTK